MSNIEKIDEIYEKMGRNPLSSILLEVSSIALECKDYEGYCILVFWGKPFCEDKEGNREYATGIYRALEKEGLKREKYEKIVSDAFEKYMSLRTIRKDAVGTLCAKELEDSIKRCEEVIATMTIPDGLAPVDLYFANENNTKTKLEIITKRQEFEREYAVLNGYITEKLTIYRRQLVLEERKKETEKGIKNTKDVFIIHGHNEAKLLELEKILKEELGLNPVILKDQPNQGLTIIDKFEKYANKCSYAIALFTPDDIVSAPNGNQYFQARPNVIFELGWFYSNLGRSRVCILEQASEKSEIFSDLQGIMRVQFNSNVQESFVMLKRELESVGMI